MFHFKVPTVQMYSFAPSVRIIVILSNSFTPGQKPKIMPVQPYMFQICMLYAKTMYYLIWAQCNNKRCFNSLNESHQSFSHREPTMTSRNAVLPIQFWPMDQGSQTLL